MKNVLKTFVVALVVAAALTGTTYAGTAKGKSTAKAHHVKHASGKTVAEKKTPAQ